MLPRGLEPRTLRLLAVRSDQLSYKSHSAQFREEPSAFFQLENFLKNQKMENLGIDPSASRMLSERSTIWARSPREEYIFK